MNKKFLNTITEVGVEEVYNGIHITTLKGKCKAKDLQPSSRREIPNESSESQP